MRIATYVSVAAFVVLGCDKSPSAGPASRPGSPPGYTAPYQYGSVRYQSGLPSETNTIRGKMEVTFSDGVVYLRSDTGMTVIPRERVISVNLSNQPPDKE